MQCRRKMLPIGCVGRHWSKVRGGLCSWRKLSALPRASVEARQYPFWESPECLWRLPAAGHPLQPLDRWRMSNCRTLRRVRSSRSVKKKSPTSACRHSTCSTRKMLQRHKARKSPGAVAEVAGVAAAAVAAGEAAPAAGAAVAAHRGDVAATARPRHFLTRLTVKGHRGWVLPDPATLFVCGAVRGTKAESALAIKCRLIDRHSLVCQTDTRQL